MFYTVYKITNKLNGKFYIGKHKTPNLYDDYMGSGKLIKSAIKKYGSENFVKEILEFCVSEEEMNLVERKLVVIDSKISYNLAPGGYGGTCFFSDETREKLSIAASKRKGSISVSADARKNLSASAKKRTVQGFAGKKHSEATLLKMQEKQRGRGIGEANSQHGTFWVTNGVSNKKMPKDSEIPAGWRKGRTLT